MAGTGKASERKRSAKGPASMRTFSSPADQVDEQLALYRNMRDFAVTSEPSGAKASPRATAARELWDKAKASGGLPFVIQKHAASHLHYDFRLGWNGVLKSWAVAKGPSYSTKDRRLAVQVEDHPMDYGGFEGIIPQGQYGGGTVMVWDQGTWTPQRGHEDIDEGLRKGSLKFEMHGSKMHGKWTLVLMHSIAQRNDGRWRSSNKPNWLLIKEHDEFERGPDDPAVVDQEPNSAVTGRTMEQIAHQEDHVWNSKGSGKDRDWYRQDTGGADPQGTGQDTGQDKKRAAPRPAPKKAAANSSKLALDTLPKESQPEFISPQLALEVKAPPSGPEWLHELKLDGYRIQARKTGGKVALLTRSGLDWTYRVRSIADAVAALPVSSVTLDGEAVVLDENGTTNFAALQASFQEGAKNPLTYFCFDLLHIDGRNPRQLTLHDRKSLLADLLQDAAADATVRLSEHLSGDGEEIFHHACELHAEGIISKRADAPYRSARGGEWVKAKCLHEQEFVIGGFTLSSDGDDRIGSLLLGYYREGDLIYAGRTGTGFTQKSRRMLRTQLEPLRLKTTAFKRVPAEARRGAIWTKPELVAQVRFATWTAEDLVRQAAFLGLREDKQASEVAREEPATAPRPKGTSQKNDHAIRKVTAPAQARSAPTLRLTHPKKVLDPESGLTKAQLAEYYWAVADHMLPHIADRPLSLVRCPEGAGKPCFYQKHVNHMLPPGVGGIDVPDKKTGVLEPYITLNTAEALAGLAQMGVLEVHPWGSCNHDLEHPDRLIFDLDPDEDLSWSILAGAAGEVRSRLKKAGLESFLKTTGGKGLHIVVPILPKLDWPRIKETTHLFVSKMERANPALYLTKMTKAARKGKIYLDYLRNERGATAVAPYSPRARPGTQVSLPLPWSALKLAERPVFSVSNFEQWRSRLRSDPWKSIAAVKQTLDTGAIAAL